MARRRKDISAIGLPIMALVAACFAIQWLMNNFKVLIGPAICVVAVVAINWYSKKRSKNLERRMWLASGIDQIDQMSGTDFEKRLYHHFNDIGWRVALTKVSGDYGADLVGTDSNGQRVVVQAKRYKGKVGVDAVQEVIGAKYHYKADRMVVVSNNELTRNALALANSANVEVWDRARLVRELAGNIKNA